MNDIEQVGNYLTQLQSYKNLQRIKRKDKIYYKTCIYIW